MNQNLFANFIQNSQKNLTMKQNEILKNVLALTGSPTFYRMLLVNFVNNNTVAIMEHGSRICNPEPNDLDVIIVLREGHRHFKMILDGILPIDLEVIPLRDLLLPIKNFHWYLLNWEFEVAKYKYGKALYDPERKIYALQKIVSDYPEDIASVTAI